MDAPEQLRYAILALQREGNRNLATALKPLGLTPSQAEVLRVLQDYAPLTLSALGDLLICESGPGPSRLIDRLVSQGAVERSISPEDRRAVTLTLSKSGMDQAMAVQKIENVMYAQIKEATSNYPVNQLLALAQTLLLNTPAGDALSRRAAPRN